MNRSAPRRAQWFRDLFLEFKIGLRPTLIWGPKPISHKDAQNQGLSSEKSATAAGGGSDGGRGGTWRGTHVRRWLPFPSSLICFTPSSHLLDKKIIRMTIARMGTKRSSTTRAPRSGSSGSGSWHTSIVARRWDGFRDHSPLRTPIEVGLRAQSGGEVRMDRSRYYCIRQAQFLRV